MSESSASNHLGILTQEGTDLPCISEAELFKSFFPETSQNLVNAQGSAATSHSPIAINSSTAEIHPSAGLDEYQQTYSQFKPEGTFLNNIPPHCQILLPQTSVEFIRPTSFPGLASFKPEDAVLCSTSYAEILNLTSTPQVDNYKMHPDIKGVVYSNVPVWEYVVNGIQVMRRCNDSFLNSTQILKVAKIDKGRRTKIMEREIFKMHHEKVQGGYGKYQGTWVPFPEGRALAQKYGVENLIMPLLNLDPNQAEIPSKAGGKEAARRFVPATTTPNRTSWKPIGGIPRSKSAQLPALGMTSTPKRQEPISKPPSTPRKRINRTLIKPDIRPVTAMNVNHNIILASLLENENLDVPLESLKLSPGELDSPLDNEGNTAAHWAAAVGRASVLHQLLALGASVTCKARDDLTPLMRAMHFSYCHDMGTFPKILALLAPSITCRDAAGRTLVHHLAIASDRLEFQESSLTYLHTLADLLSPLKPILPQIQLSSFTQLLDMQDNEGNTASHLGAHLNALKLTANLAKYGAKFDIPNNAGFTTNELISESPYLSSPKELLSPHLFLPIHAPASRASEASDCKSHFNFYNPKDISQLVSEVEVSYQTQLQQYQREVLSLKIDLQNARHFITQLQHQLHNAGIQVPTEAHYQLPILSQGTATQISLQSDFSPASLSVSPDDIGVSSSNPVSQPVPCTPQNPSTPVSSPPNSSG